ncbi:pyridoxamine 5'-phosphate oxidase family protein [Actinocatenispora thailandica]|uniref:pyridoxamine 5'-phosphate oxidase family protein n=1 Tax=Actinocatenispora thailandica TaxID=227318 RepID=UPI001EF2FA8D|nr:pyridoxamine 5'-phosphate oxidase family protein [Actinocatenispora thailandica]
MGQIGGHTGNVITDRIRVRRAADRGRYTRADVEQVLDASLVAHVAFVDSGQPWCIPFLHARVGDVVYLHGSTGSRAMRVLAAGAEACLTVTVLDGLVLARSVFEHSANYRSAVLFGRFAPVSPDRRAVALRAFTERLVPGRWDEVRGPSEKELAKTSILAMAWDEASVKVRTGPPSDGRSPDATDDAWAGVLPFATGFGPPQPAPELPVGLPLPRSVRAVYGPDPDAAKEGRQNRR